MVAKTIDEIYVLSTIAKSKKVELLKISKVMWSLLKSLPQLRNGRKEENKFFNWSLFHSLEFQKGKCQVFWSSFGSCIAISWLAVLWLHENIGLETLPMLQRIFNYLSKTAAKSLKKRSLFKLINKCTRTMHSRLASVFFINLEHFSHPILVLLL